MNKNQIFLEKIKAYEESTNSIRDYVKEKFINENGEAVIDVFCNNDQLFTSFSGDKKSKLSNDIISFIDDEVYNIPTNVPVIVNFIDEQLTREEEVAVERAYHEHYGLIFKDKSVDVRLNSVKSLALAILGAVLLSVSYLLNKINVGDFFREFMSIAASFSLWESVDFFFLERKDLMIQRLNAAQMAVSRITFNHKPLK